jgi:hypothetical protein
VKPGRDRAPPPARVTPGGRDLPLARQPCAPPCRSAPPLWPVPAAGTAAPPLWQPATAIKACSPGHATGLLPHSHSGHLHEGSRPTGPRRTVSHQPEVYAEIFLLTAIDGHRSSWSSNILARTAFPRL